MKTIIGTCIKTCPDNSDFLELNEYDVVCLSKKYGSKEIENEIDNLISKIRECNNNHRYNKKIAIKKDSILGNYILSLPSNEVYNYDDIITFEKVTNALNVAIFENNPISSELVELFRKQVSGSKGIIAFKYGLNVVDYILKNNDFKSYIQKINGVYEPTKYLVYEDGELKEKIILISEKQKIIQK